MPARTGLGAYTTLLTPDRHKFLYELCLINVQFCVPTYGFDLKMCTLRTKDSLDDLQHTDTLTHVENISDNAYA